MEVHHDSRVRHPRSLVFRTYRDRLPDLVALLPNVSGVELLERREEGSRVHLVNRWRARGQVPKVAQGIVDPDMLTWIDRAVWDEEDWSCTWVFEPGFLPGKVDARGRNAFLPDGEGHTEVRIRGDLRLPESGLPGVPSLAAKVVVPQIERFVVALVTPNMARVTAALERFLDSRADG